jgi:hypothetical protein
VACGVRGFGVGEGDGDGREPELADPQPVDIVL